MLHFQLVLVADSVHQCLLQQLFICISKKIGNWNTDDIDQILNIGDKQYNISAKKLKEVGKYDNAYLTIDEIHPYVVIKNKQY